MQWWNNYHIDKFSGAFNRWSVFGALTILLMYNQKQLSYDYV